MPLSKDRALCDRKYVPLQAAICHQDIDRIEQEEQQDAGYGKHERTAGAR